MILEQAVRDRASDVHIEPQDDGLRIRVPYRRRAPRIMKLPSGMAGPLVSRVKVLADMNIVERRRPQDGQMQVTSPAVTSMFASPTSSTVFGEMCVMRLLDKSAPSTSSPSSACPTTPTRRTAS